jgi:predicted RNase H-like nuclease (RuvC/YqgF family)
MGNGKQLIPTDGSGGPKALEDHIEQSLRGVGEMRIENVRLKRQAADYEQDRDQLTGEIENLQHDLEDARVAITEREKTIAQLRATCETLEIMLQREAEERSYYTAFSIEIVTQLNVCGDIIAKAIAKSKTLAEDAEKEAAGHAEFAPGGLGGARLNLPKVDLPSFVKRRNGEDDL